MVILRIVGDRRRLRRGVVQHAEQGWAGRARRLRSVQRVHFTMGVASSSGLCPTFLEGVSANHRMHSGRLTPSRKVGSGPNLKCARVQLARHLEADQRAKRVAYQTVRAGVRERTLQQRHIVRCNRLDALRNGLVGI